MAASRAAWLVLVCVAYHVAVPCHASSGDRGADFLACLKDCSTTGCHVDCIPGCSPVANETDGGTAAQQVTEPWELKFTQWTCDKECQYQCMVFRENRKAAKGQPVEKYYGKWPFRRVLGMQEPASVLFSVLNFLANLVGLLHFIHLVYCELPRRPMGDKGPLYEYAGLWIVYGLTALNSWFWSAVFHTRDTPYTQAWDYSSAIALIGGVLLLAIIRTSSLRLEAARVMVSAPVIAFTATHILYLNNYDFDFGWNIKVCTTMGILQLLLWLVWAFVTRHPARVKLLVVVIGTSLAMLLELYDFPPKWGVLDAHACWHAATIPLIYLWWSFVRDDARARTKDLQRRTTEKDKKAA